jgi:hypothetical protein
VVLAEVTAVAAFGSFKAGTSKWSYSYVCSLGARCQLSDLSSPLWILLCDL